MFASSLAYWIFCIHHDNRNSVINWIYFFDNESALHHATYECDAYCYICLVVWLVLFIAGCYVQYSFHKRHKKAEYEDEISKDSLDDDGRKSSNKNGPQRITSTSPRTQYDQRTSYAQPSTELQNANNPSSRRFNGQSNVQYI